MFFQFKKLNIGANENRFSSTVMLAGTLKNFTLEIALHAPAYVLLWTSLPTSNSCFSLCVAMRICRKGSCSHPVNQMF